MPEDSNKDKIIMEYEVFINRFDMVNDLTEQDRADFMVMQEKIKKRQRDRFEKSLPYKGGA